MDFQIFGDSLKIKIKKATIALDPKTSIQKFDADSILLLDKSSDTQRINNFRVVIDRQGEYEVSGIKILGVKSEDGIFFVLSSDNNDAILVKASTLSKVSLEKIGEHRIAIINVDSDLNQSAVTAMEPRIVILYGEKARSGAKALGKENIESSSKISIQEDKLPEETEIFILS